MTKITVTIEADEPAELYQALRGFLAAAPGALGDGLGVPEGEIPAGGAAPTWDYDHFARLWASINANARHLLRAFAERPEGYPIDEVGERLGLTSQQIAGRLSSVGHQLRQFGDRPHPVGWVAATRSYTLSPEIAGYIRELSQ